MIDSYEQNPLYSFSTEGVYTVSLYVNNAFGFSTETKMNFVAITIQEISKILIIDLDITPQGETLKNSVENSCNYPVFYTTQFDEYPITSDFDAIFLLLGIYANNHQLSESEAQDLVNYLNSGGNLYIEGGDIWGYDPSTSLHPMLNINGVSDGTNGGDLSNLIGNEFLSGMQWTYSGENNWIDRLEPLNDATVIFSNPDVGYDCGIANDTGTYKTVGCSFEVTGIGGTNSLDDAVYGILDFFELTANNEVTQQHIIPTNDQTEFSFDDVDTDLQFMSTHPETTIEIIFHQFQPTTFGILPRGIDNIAQ